MRDYEKNFINFLYALCDLGGKKISGNCCRIVDAGFTHSDERLVEGIRRMKI